MSGASCWSTKAVKLSGSSHKAPRHCAATAYRTSDDKYQRYNQTDEYSAPPPPPPPPPPFFDEAFGPGPRQSPFGQGDDDGGQVIVGAGLAALVALGFVYGFRDDDSAALRAARSLPPPQAAQVTAPPSAPAQLQQQATFPSTVLPGEIPIGMQGQWEHRWRYDGNGQPFLQLKGRWWRLERQAGSRLLVTFYDTQNKLRPGLAYVYSPPPEWPVDEVDLTNQVTMALLFGQEDQLEDRLQLVE